MLMIVFSAIYGAIYWSARDELRRYIGGRFYAGYALTMLCGFILPSLVLFDAAAFVIFVATVRNRVDAVCRYVMMVLLAPSLSLPIQAGSTYLLDISVIFVLSMALAVSLLMYPAPRLAKPRGFAPEDALVVILIALFWIAADRFSSSTVFLRNGLGQLLGIGFIYVLLRQNVRSAQEARLLFGCVAVVAGLLAGLAVVEATLGWSFYSPVLNGLSVRGGISAYSMKRGDLLRAAVSMSGPLNLGCFLLIGIVAVLSSRSLLGTRWQWQCALALTFVGLLATQSRGNLVGLVLGVGVFMLARGKGGRAIGVVIAAGVIGGVAMLLAKHSGFLSGMFAQNEALPGEYYDYRELLLSRGLEEGAKHPIFGARLSDVIDRLQDITQGQHIVDMVNTYLTIYLISGLVGLACFLGVAGLVLARLVTGFRGLRDPEVIRLRAFVLAGIVMLLFQISFMSLIDRMPFLIALMLAASRLIYTVHRRQRTAARQGQGDPASAPTRHRGSPALA